jgi:plastocyanin
MRRFAILLVSSLAVMAVAACGGPSSSPSQAASQPASVPASQPAGSAAAACAEAATGTVTVNIEGNAYAPDPVTAGVGEAIQWTNADAVPHTATLDEGDCGTETIDAGATLGLVFNEAGTYTYHCTVHPAMTGTIEIE